MIVYSHGIRISCVLLGIMATLFFYNLSPKFLLPWKYFNFRLFVVYRLLVYISLAIVVLLPLRISFVRDTQVVVEKDFPVQVVLDVSLSMAATDFSPSRFAVAKRSLISLVQALDGYAVSFVAFSGKPFVYMPFSTDVAAITSKLTHMNLGDFPPVQEFLGTAIGDALLLAINNLQQFFVYETSRPGIVILVTDGDSNLGWDPMDVIAFYQKINVPLYILGVGQKNFLIGYDSRNDAVMTDIHPDFLEELAHVTGGKFYRILEEQSFDDFLQDFLVDVVARQRQTVQTHYWQLNDYLLFVLVCSLLGIFVLRVYTPRNRR